MHVHKGFKKTKAAHQDYCILTENKQSGGIKIQFTKLFSKT